MTPSGSPLSAGTKTSITVSLTNNGVTPVATIAPLGLTASAGWVLGTNSDRPRLLGKDDTDSVTISATGTPSQPIGTAAFTGSASYRDLTGLRKPASALSIPSAGPRGSRST